MEEEEELVSQSPPLPVRITVTIAPPIQQQRLIGNNSIDGGGEIGAGGGSAGGEIGGGGGSEGGDIDGDGSGGGGGIDCGVAGVGNGGIGGGVVDGGVGSGGIIVDGGAGGGTFVAGGSGGGVVGGGGGGESGAIVVGGGAGGGVIVGGGAGGNGGGVSGEGGGGGIGRVLLGGGSAGGNGGGSVVGGGGGGGREDCWSEGATEVLIEAWGERFVDLKRGNLKQNHWKEVADIVNSRDDYMKTPRTDNQCKNRIDTVKKKFKTEKQRIAMSGGRSSWRFFDRMEELIGPNVKATPTAVASPSVFATGYDGGNVPMGIPVGVRPRPMQILPQFRQPERFQPPPQQPMYIQQTPNLKGRVKRDRDEEVSGGFPPERFLRKQQKRERELLDKGMNGNEKSRWGNTVMELSTAIMKLGEAYQHAESMKLQQLVEMEKHRMKFTKELELQRMQFMTRTQIEISHMKWKLKQQRSHRKQ
ncbi:hypothetical protein Leryth_001824 [Lithospermum erythrorhizon]|nr:hypothetical protein Leryth_001824 [Lithospermum erythrorhizon]